VVTAVRLLGQALGGLGVIVYVVVYAAGKWFSGGQWRHTHRGRRLVTRPVRATLQTAATVLVAGAVAGGLMVGWLVTATTLAAAGTTLVATPLAWRRYRQYRDRRVVVHVGEVIPNRPGRVRELEPAR
jgi:hypothetical protein